MLTGLLGVIVGIAAVLLAIWAIDAVAGDDDDVDGGTSVVTQPVAAPADVLSVGTVMSNPEGYLGQEVTVGGTLRGAVSPSLAFFGGAAYDTDNLLLLTGEETPGAFPSGADARATGTLTRLDIAEAEERLGVDLDDALLEDFVGDVTLLADSVHYFIAGEFSATSMIDLTGQEVTFVGSVGEQVSERVFLADDILVIIEEGVEFEAATTNEDAIIRAHGIGGVVTEDDPAIGAALSQDQIEEYRGHARLIADSVEFIE